MEISPPNEIFVLKCESESSPLSIKNHQRDLDIDPLALSNEKNDCTGTDDDSGKDSIQFAGDYDVYDSDDLIVYSPEGVDTQEENGDADVSSDYKYSETFLQRENCFATSQLLPQCYECENDPMTNKFTCRFYEFRKIERVNGTFKVAGFLDPHIDPSVADLDLWTVPDGGLEVNQETADHILTFVASQFCEMAKEELKVHRHHNSDGNAWKRSVLQVREICDVCNTSLFNFHWTCTFCGTCVCIDCKKERELGRVRWKPVTKVDKEERDNFFWLKCQNHKDHDMMLTQITTGDALKLLNENLHKICEQRNITQRCGCSLRTKNCVKMISKSVLLEQPRPNQPSELVLKEVMKRQRYKMKPMRRMSLMEQQLIYRRVKTSYISQGRILKILDPSESQDNYKIFQDQWEQGKPVIVANVTKNIRKFIWSPEYFSMRFGNEKHAMVDCENDAVIKQVAMKYFWDGFKSFKRRLPRDCEEKVVLKLKDWPTSDDFADVMKEHFAEAMKAVPMSAYTHRNGRFNLARYLPEHFSRPDLGPKMYSAYSQCHPSKQGSTNLHLDVSDAVNVMVHVSKPDDAHLAPDQYSLKATRIALELAGADEADKSRLEGGFDLPGAIWHIWPAHQADDIRNLLRIVAKESGKPLGANDDPIHDQNWYIDSTLRKRLKEKGVDGYTIIQYEGDAVFIPAGAPHQVLNVLDCIKVALDFVAPENLSECLNLTEEFRALSTRHQNHEDKLQIKNILYHTIKNLVPAEPNM